jgi:hypothetical protein
MIDWPDEPVMTALRQIDTEAVGRLFAVGELPEPELANGETPCVLANRGNLLLATESLLKKLGPRGSVVVEISGFACKFGGRKTPVQSGSTGFFQISGSDQWYQLDAQGAVLQLKKFERRGSELTYVGSEQPAPGTEIQPISYETSYIIGRLRRRIGIARELRRLRDFLAKVQDQQIRVSLVV